MASTRAILPEAINNFNAYKEGNILIGITGEMTLSEFSAMTATMSGTGILGEMETPIVGAYGSIKQEIPFAMLEEDIFSLANPVEAQEITLRMSKQSTVKASGNIEFKGMRIVFRGRPVAFNAGTLKQGAQMGASVTLEVMYVLIEIDGQQKLELDKLNNVYKVNGVDLLAEVKRQC